MRIEIELKLKAGVLSLLPCVTARMKYISTDMAQSIADTTVEDIKNLKLARNVMSIFTNILL